MSAIYARNERRLREYVHAREAGTIGAAEPRRLEPLVWSKRFVPVIISRERVDDEIRQLQRRGSYADLVRGAAIVAIYDYDDGLVDATKSSIDYIRRATADLTIEEVESMIPDMDCYGQRKKAAEHYLALLRLLPTTDYSPGIEQEPTGPWDDPGFFGDDS